MPERDAFDSSNPIVAKPADVEVEAEAKGLLALPAAEAAKQILKDWDDSYKYVRPIAEQWKLNAWRALGYTGGRMIAENDLLKAYLPLGATPNLATMNIANRLVRRMRSIMFADQPQPEGTPSSDEDEDRDAAEFSTRVLLDVCGEGNLRYNLASGNAFQAGGIYGSGFLRFWTDPRGGGWQPQAIMASPQAQTKQDALADPTTGQPWPGEYVRRYVKTDGTLTDEKADPDVAKQWLPKVCREILSGKHVRFLPWNCEDVWDADGLMVGIFTPLGQLKNQFPQLATFPDSALQEIVSARPRDAKDLLPKGSKSAGVADSVKDDALVFTVCRYHRQSTKYPKGAYLLACGEDTLLWPPADQPDFGILWDEEHAEPCDIPVTQFKQYEAEDNPYGEGLMYHLGPGNEVLAFLTGVILDHLDKFSRRKQYLPMNSNLQPEQLQADSATVLQIIPGGEPKFEEIPDLPPYVERVMAELRQDMNDESGLQQAAQGVNSPEVKSGLHAQTIIEQVMQGISDLREHTEAGLVRGWRIVLQLIRKDYTVPQQIQWTGEDGDYKQREFTGADLGSTSDVRLQRGSFTQMTPSAKASVAEHLFGLRDPQGRAVLEIEDIRHIVGGNLGGLLGVEDNAHLLRVRRQIAKWREGPPEGWTPPQPGIDPATGQPAPPPPDPALAAIFQSVPVDEQPNVANIRAYELGRAIASTNFQRWPPPWQQPLVAEYDHMRQMAGIQTVRDQQQAAQQQQQAQQQAQQQQMQAQQGQEQAKGQIEMQKAQLVAQTQLALKNADIGSTERAQQAQLAQKAGQDQQVQQMAATHQEGMAALIERVAENLKPQPLPPISVQVPGQEAQTQVLSQVAETMQQVAEAVSQVGEGTAQLAGVVSQLTKPKKLVVKRNKQGKMTGVEPVE